jgi:16S rRNA (guanine527-N7)-methyltransferase
MARRSTSVAFSEASQDQKRRLLRRARKENVSLPGDLADALLAYLELLALWNRKINLTALDDPDAAIDRLILEPLIAAKHLPPEAAVIDIGSGGGSPAIPLKLAVPKLRLWMVESKVRKSAFLREAIRQLDLRETFVETRRYEEMLSLPAMHESMDVVTIRAVKVETATLIGLQAFVKQEGQILLFRGQGDGGFEHLPPPLKFESEEPLVEALRSRLVKIRKVGVHI